MLFNRPYVIMGWPRYQAFHPILQMVLNKCPDRNIFTNHITFYNELPIQFPLWFITLLYSLIDLIRGIWARTCTCNSYLEFWHWIDHQLEHLFLWKFAQFNNLFNFLSLNKACIQKWCDWRYWWYNSLFDLLFGF